MKIYSGMDNGCLCFHLQAIRSGGNLKECSVRCFLGLPQDRKSFVAEVRMPPVSIGTVLEQELVGDAKLVVAECINPFGKKSFAAVRRCAFRSAVDVGWLVNLLR